MPELASGTTIRPPSRRLRRGSNILTGQRLVGRPRVVASDWLASRPRSWVSRSRISGNEHGPD
jgi:hypothetical protein